MSICPVAAASPQCLNRALLMSTKSSCLHCFVQWYVALSVSCSLTLVFASVNWCWTAQCLSHWPLLFLISECVSSDVFGVDCLWFLV